MIKKYEWENEPDDVIFYYKGLYCHIKRHLTWGHLCGYVHLPKGRAIDVTKLEVHGGITYDKKGEKKDKRVIGFDCAHSSDFCPARHLGYCDDLFEKGKLIYRNLDFVTKELKRLVDQIEEQGHE